MKVLQDTQLQCVAGAGPAAAGYLSGRAVSEITAVIVSDLQRGEETVVFPAYQDAARHHYGVINR